MSRGSDFNGGVRKVLSEKMIYEQIREGSKGVNVNIRHCLSFSEDGQGEI